MNIKEIINSERWQEYEVNNTDCPSDAHNASLSRIQAAVLTYVIKLEKQVSTLEKAFIFEGKKFEERIKDLEAENAALKAQVPKVVKPSTDYHCECGAIVKNDGVYENYCWSCGARLDWLTSVTCDHNCPKCKLWLGGWACPEIEIIITKEEK